MATRLGLQALRRGVGTAGDAGRSLQAMPEYIPGTVVSGTGWCMSCLSHHVITPGGAFPDDERVQQIDGVEPKEGFSLWRLRLVARVWKWCPIKLLTATRVPYIMMGQKTRIRAFVAQYFMACMTWGITLVNRVRACRVCRRGSARAAVPAPPNKALGQPRP